MKGDTTNELHIEVHHLPFQRLAVDEDFTSTEAASGVFHHRIRIRKNALQIIRPSFRKPIFDPGEGFFPLLNR